MVKLNIYFFVKKIGSTTNAEHEESNILTIQDKNRTKILGSSLKKEKKTITRTAEACYTFPLKKNILSVKNTKNVL